MSDSKKEIINRLEELKDMLMSTYGERRLYGCDEWSSPIININQIISLVEKLDRRAGEPRKAVL